MRLFARALPLIAGACLAQNPVVVENGWVRVVRAANIPGQLSRPHVHLVNRVMIHLDKGALRIDNKETGVARDIPFRAGEVRWDPRVGLHTSENTGGTAIRIVEIELNDNPPRADKAPDRLPAPASRYKAEMENGQVRILRTTLNANEKSLGFATPIVAVRLSDGETLFRPANGPAVTNETTQPADWIFVELK
ncbi:MAG: hypothetical protein HYX27_01645 [Acidobacteria bacterium]|nr:hypothetical protein [Acidobacteriota bacterium]